MKVSRKMMVEQKKETIAGYICMNLDKVEVWAYAENDGLHYKSFWFTPWGCWNSDTPGGVLRTVKEGRGIVRSYGKRMKRYAAKEIVQNWISHGLDSRRKFEKQIVAQIEQPNNLSDCVASLHFESLKS